MPAIYTSRVSIGTSATALVPDQLRYGLVVRNLGPGTVYVGNSAVTTGTGFPLAPDQTLALGGTQWAGAGGEASTAAYAVSDSSAVVAVLEVR